MGPDGFVSDTTHDTTAALHRMYAARSPVERLKMGCALYDAALQMVRASLKEESSNPAALFLRLHGPDFDSATRARIVRHLQKMARG
ncbi:MAG: hypothetical protein HY696_07755 [Deltaproteobacteria bacterium]|nr:hypothetical protein [Deltaproteobacteria bacterium]